MANFIVNIINKLIQALAVVAKTALSILPKSPFAYLDSIEIPFLEELNWVIPVDFMIFVLSIWVTSISIYFLVSIILRWVKAIE